MEARATISPRAVGAAKRIGEGRLVQMTGSASHESRGDAHPAEPPLMRRMCMIGSLASTCVSQAGELRLDRSIDPQRCRQCDGSTSDVSGGKAMDRREIQDIGRRLTELARPEYTPKQLFDIVKARHPKGKRKDITHAALAMMIASARAAPAVALQLQSFALSQRAVTDGEWKHTFSAPGIDEDGGPCR